MSSGVPPSTRAGSNGAHPGSGGTESAVDVALVRSIHGTVVGRWESEPDRARLDDADRRQLIRSWIQEELTEESRRRMVSRGGYRQLTRDEEVGVLRAVENAIWGLGQLQQLLDIPDVQDIYLTGAQLPMLRLRNGRVQQAGLPFADTDDELIGRLQHLAAHHGSAERAFSPAQPFLNMGLPDGSRLAAIRDVVPRPVVTIRRHHFLDATLARMVELGTLSPQMAQFLAAAVAARLNILITGRPVAGNTTLLRALASVISPDERIATLETEFELNLHRLDRYPLLVAMECRAGSTEIDPASGRRAGEITLSDLLYQALRISVTRVIVGEVRGEEALPMLEAMNAGMPGSMCTLHASSAADAFERLITAALKGAGRGWSDSFVTRLAAQGIDYVVHVRHIDHTGHGGGEHRVVAEIAEVTGVNEAGVVTMNRIFAPERGSGDPRGVVQTLPQNREPFYEIGVDLAFLNDARLGWQTPRLRLRQPWT